MYKASGNTCDRDRIVSIIVPIFNEEASITRLLDQLVQVKDRCEVIFVDGGSTDATRSLIPSSWTVLESPCGRGRQLNAGYEASTGDVLFFLHCDSILPPGFLDQICEVMDLCDMGFFGVRFDSPDWVMGICGRQSNRRARYRHIPFGDQGIFIKRDLFERLGCFPEIPIMEDYQFSLSARKAGVRMGQTKDVIVTSARRYGTGFFHQLWVMYFMHKLRWLHRKGIPEEQILAMYQEMR